MNARAYIVAGVVACAVSFGAGRYTKPARVEERVVTQYKDRAVVEYRDRIVERRVQGPVRVVTRTVEKPGGERIVERTVERAPVVEERSSAPSLAAHLEHEAASSSATVTTREQPRLLVGLEAAWNLRDPRLRPDAGGQVMYRARGPLWAGLRVSEAQGGIAAVQAAISF